MGKTQGFQLTTTVSNISWRIVPGNEGQADKNPLLINMGSKLAVAGSCTVVVGIASGVVDPAEKAIAKTLNLDSYEYPLVAVVDRHGRILFHNNGYSIGLAEQLLKYCKP